MTKRANKLIISLILICLMAPVIAQPVSVPPKLQAAILIKALSYDRRLAGSSGHIVIGIVVNRLSVLPQAIFKICTSIISIVVVGLMTWANILVLNSRWLEEDTIVLGIPVLPFRIIFVTGFCFFGAALLVNIYKQINRIRKNESS